MTWPNEEIMSDNTPEPDFKTIAERLAKDRYRFQINETIGNIKIGHKRKGYATCMEAKLKSDWETIRLLKECRDAMASNDVHGWVDGLEAHLSALLKPFQERDNGCA